MNELPEDGRKIIDEAYQIIKTLYENRENIAVSYTGADLESFNAALENGFNWTRKCRNKVWLRTIEGVEKAKVVLHAANELRDSLPTADADSAAKSFADEAAKLGKELSYKVSIIT